MKAFIKYLLTMAARDLAAALQARAARRTMASLDGCEYCGEPGEFFLDVTPDARHVTARLACTACAAEATRTGAQVLMGSDGRPVKRGHP